MRILRHPVKKLTLAAAFAGGYVLGAKAGRERYEEIVRLAQQAKADPRVQQAADRAEDLAREAAAKVSDDPRVEDVVDTVKGAAEDAAEKATDTVEQAKRTAAARVEDAKSKATQTVEEATDQASKKADEAKAKAAAPKKARARPAPKAEVNPLLADEHVETAEEVVFSSGPDVEESIDERIDPETGDAKG